MTTRGRRTWLAKSADTLLQPFRFGVEGSGAGDVGASRAVGSAFIVGSG